jgi:AraC family transcriptional activator of pobA
MTDLPVCNMELFGNSVRQFWMEDLEELLVKYPNLEFPHRASFFLLLLIDRAQGEISIDDQKIRLDESKAIIIKPYCINSIYINRAAKGKIICFTEDFFSLRYNDNVLQKFGFNAIQGNNFFRINERQKERWILLMGLMQDEFSTNKQDYISVIRSYLNILLFEFDRSLNTGLFSSVFRTKNIRQDKVFEFENLIEKHFLIHKLPSEYAEKLHLTANYLNKICKEERGQTAGALIRKRLIIEAQRLLQYTNLSINEIAYKLGFENSSYFITVFKRETSFPPDKYRKLN